MYRSPAISFYLLICGVFLAIISPHFLSEGMFMDGLIYAVVSRNLAFGEGSFWQLHLSGGLHPWFREHPPLVMGLQSLFFRLWGDHYWVEKVYSLLTYALSAGVMYKIWQHLLPQEGRQSFWLPLLLWLIMPTVIWASTNNMLENSMTFFCLLSIYFMLKQAERFRLIYLLAGGLSLCAAVLCKGLVALFPLALPFWIMIFRENYKFGSFVRDSLLWILCAILPLIVLFWIDPQSWTSLQAYFAVQVQGSLERVQTVDSRFYILGSLLSELILPALVCLIFFFTQRKNIAAQNPHLKTVFILFALGLSGVVPIMISLKQRGFYLLSALPLFAMVLSLWVWPYVSHWMETISHRQVVQKWLRVGALLLLTGGIMANIYYAGKSGRDKAKIADVKKIRAAIGEEQWIDVAPHLRADWSLHAYFARYARIDLDTLSAVERPYFLIDHNGDFATEGQEMPLGLQQYRLYRRAEN